MRLLDILVEAPRGLGTHRLRTFLTLLGIVIGVSAVISLMSVGQGAQAAITSRIEGMGTNLIFVRPGAVTQDRVRSAQGSAATLTLEDAQALADPSAVPAVALVAPETNSFAQVVAGTQNANTRVLGVTPEYLVVRNYTLADGDFISPQNLEARSTVVVLGANVAQTLSPDFSLVGQTIRIGAVPFRVIGILQSKGGTGMGSEDDLVMVPLTTAQYRLTSQRTVAGGRTVSVINVQAVDAKYISAAKEQIAAILRERHRITLEDDFTVTSQEEVLQARTEVTNVLTIFLGCIAGIALLVGGIGIMNIMLVSVSERTREIGIRKAVGAKQRHILAQFLLEATLLSLGGGLLGVGLGWGIARLISGLSLAGQTIQTQVSADIVILALAVSTAIGLFFGIYPARRAARLNPIEALRYE